MGKLFGYTQRAKNGKTIQKMMYLSTFLKKKISTTLALLELLGLNFFVFDAHSIAVSSNFKKNGQLSEMSEKSTI